MRTLVRALGVVLAMTLTASAGQASALDAGGSTRASTQADATAELHIWRRATPPRPYDTNPDGGGPYAPSTRVTGQLKNCVPGEYLLSATLVQDGRSYPWADGGAMGAGEVFCGVFGAPTTVPVGMSFYGTGLHPGRARAVFELNDCCGAGTTVRAARTVWIPRRY